MSRLTQNDNKVQLYQVIKRFDIITAQNLIYNGVDLNTTDENGNTSLHWAIVKLKDVDIVELLLKKGAHIHVKNHDNHKPLHVAIQHNKPKVVSLLIKNGALVAEDLNSLLLIAIEKNKHTIVKMIIDHRVQSRSSIDRKILDAAISQGNPKIIEQIIPYCRFSKPSDKYISRKLVIWDSLKYKESIELLLKWNFTINPDHCHDKCFIYGTVENGYLQIVLQLLKYGIDVNMVSGRLSLLAIACLKKHHEIIENLLHHKANINVTMNSQYGIFKNHLCFYDRIRSSFNGSITCLHISVFNRDPVMTQLLLKHGVMIKDDPTFFNITCMAVHNNCEEIVRIFLEHGVDINNVDVHGKTLLHSFVHSDSCKINYNYEVAKLLLEKGANIHLQTPGNSLVFDAIDNRHYKIAQLFLDYNADVHYVSPDGDSLLHKAIEKDFDTEFIKTLLKLNSPADVNNAKGLTPLHVACKIKSKNQIEIIGALLHYNVDVNCTDNFFETPLHIACEAHNLELVRVLLEKGANPNVTNHLGQTLLHRVCKSHSEMIPKIIQLLLEYNANIEAVDKNGWTPLLIACNITNNAAIKCLLGNNANPNAINDKSQTPLHLVCEWKNNLTSSTIQLLLDHGANTEIVDKKGWTPLFTACFIGIDVAVKCLLDNNANLQATNNEGQTALHFVCKYESNLILRIIQLLLKHNANIEAVDKNGWTPLFVACEKGNKVAVRSLLRYKYNFSDVNMLLDCKVNVHCIDKMGNSIIHIIVLNNKVGFIKIFADTDVNFNSVNKDGNTPLHIAVNRSSTPMTSTLMKYGADVNILNKNNLTPLQSVIEQKFPRYKIIELLKIQVVKLNAAGLKVNNEDLDIIYNSNGSEENITMNVSQLTQLNAKCEQEIETMKRESIGIDNITFYDLLKLKIHFLSRFVGNEKIQEILELEVYDNKFPLYIDLIRNRLREAKIQYGRYILVNFAIEYFCENVCQRLPEECIDLVFSYLNIEDLNKFIEAMKSLKTQSLSLKKYYKTRNYFYNIDIHFRSANF